MLNQHQHQQKQRGTATVELVIVFPTFLFLCLLVIELSMMWTDRHVLHLAAFEAARTLAIVDTSGTPCTNAKALRAAERAAVLKAAIISPSPAVFLRPLLQANQFQSSLDSVEGKLDTTLGSTRIGAALKRQALGIPSAYALTHIDCHQDDSGMLEVELRYLRAPKMPFVGGALWASFILSRINESGLGKFVHFDLDQYYFGAKAKSPQLTAFADKYALVKNGMETAVGSAANLGVDLHGLANLTRSLPGGDQLGTMFTKAGDALSDGAVAAHRRIDDLSAPIEHSIEALQNSLNDHTRVLTALIHKVPNSLRLIPMRVTVRLRPDFADRRGDPDWVDGKANLLAPFTLDGLQSFATESLELWRGWAKNLSSPSKNLGQSGEGT